MSDVQETQAPSLKPDAVILLGRGGIGSAASQELQTLVQALSQELGPPTQVMAAFVDKVLPSLPEALDICSHASTVVVVPVFVPDEPALRRWLHKVVLRWQSTATTQPQLFFTPPLLQTAGIASVLAGRLQTLQPDDTVLAQVDGEWQRDPVAWSSVPEHQHHVLWCTGPRCAAKGALSLWPQLGEIVRNHAALKNSVRPLQTSCQYPCNHGPMMIVYPDGVWYGDLDTHNLEQVLVQHVAERSVNQKRRFHGPSSLAGHENETV